MSEQDDDIYEVNKEFKERADAIIQARKEAYEYKHACLRAHLCPSCGSALKDVTGWLGKIAFYPIETWQCINCQKRYHC